MRQTCGEEATRTARIVNRKGLHARAAAKVAKLAGDYTASVTIENAGEKASARSIMDLLLLVAHTGCEVEITASGPDADAAAGAIASLIESGFGEEDAQDAQR